jgi:hypothetical protein
MSTLRTKIGAAATLVALGGLTAYALASEPTDASPSAPVEVRTQVERQTIHRTRHVKPKHRAGDRRGGATAPAPAPAPAPAVQSGPGPSPSAGSGPVPAARSGHDVGDDHGGERREDDHGGGGDDDGGFDDHGGGDHSGHGGGGDDD